MRVLGLGEVSSLQRGMIKIETREKKQKNLESQTVEVEVEVEEGEKKKKTTKTIKGALPQCCLFPNRCSSRQKRLSCLLRQTKAAMNQH